MNHLVRYLRKKSIEELIDEFKIVVKQHSEYGNLYQFKYHQFDSPMRNSVVQTCRGIILDKDNNWNVVAWPYNKFFNYGDERAPDIDWQNAQVFEKLDGTLCILYFYDKKWNVATPGSPDAQGNVNEESDLTFSELFWGVWNLQDYLLPNETHKTFMFELMTPMNKIVVQHDLERIVLHGVRDNEYGYEEFPEYYAQKYGWECVKRYDFRSKDKVLNMIQSMNGSEQEGFVVCDSSFNRLKIKCDDYVRKHRMLDGISTRNMLDVIRNNESDEFLLYFPEYQDKFDKLKEEYRNIINQIEYDYNKIKNIKNQKTFAQKAKESKYPHACFGMRSKNISAKEYLANIYLKSFEKLFEKEDNE